MIKFIKPMIFIIVLISSIEVFAHPGHGHYEGNSLLHYIASPFHIMPFMLIVGVGVFVFVQKYMNKLEKQGMKK